MTTRSVPGGSVGLGVPDHRRLAAGDEPQRARHVALAIDAGKNEHRGFHESIETLPLRGPRPRYFTSAFLTSGQPPWSSGRNAWSAGTCSTILR